MDVLTAEFLHRHAHGGSGLSAGVAAIAAGDVVTAAEHLGAVVDGSDDPLLRARAAAYHRLATHLRWNAFPGGGAAEATEISVRWAREPSDIDVREDWAALARRTGDEATVAEVRAAGGVLCALRSVRVIVDYAAVRLQPAHVDAHLEDALSVVGPLRGADDPALRGYAELASADLAHRARRPERAAQLLRAAARTYGAAEQHAGLGACHLLRGDWRAAPATTPEARNLTLVASAAESSALDWALEAREADLTGLDTDGALAAYADAEEAFEAAGATRGLVAVALRRGHLAALAGDYEEAARIAAGAAAQSTACADRWGSWLARMHEALAAIGGGRLTAGAQTAEQVGKWGVGSGSFSYALGLGLLCSRSGRDWLLRRADPERALAAHRLARTVFAALGAVTDEAQSLVDHGRVLQVVGDLQGAERAYEEALDLLAEEARPAATGDNTLRAVTLAQSLYQFHLARRDPTGMARAAQRLRTQAGRLPRSPDGDSVEAKLADAAESTLDQVAVLVPLYRGEAAREAGDAAGAAAGYAEALDAVRDGHVADADFLEAVVLGHWRRYAEAATAFHRYLDVQAARPGLLGRVLSRFGPLKAELEVREQQLHEQAAAFFRRLRDYPAAVRHFEALERQGGATWWARLERPWELLTDYGTACAGIGELDRALALHDQAVAEFESRRPRVQHDEQTAFSGTWGAAAVHLNAARTALRMSQARQDSGDVRDADAWVARAFDYAERGRARGLLDVLTSGLERAPRGPGRGAARAWHEANAELSMAERLLAVEGSAAHADPDRLAALHDNVTAAQGTLADREAELAQADPRFADCVAGPTATMAADEVRAALPPGSALLVYDQVDEDLLAWAVTTDGLTANRVAVDGADLARDMREFTRACAHGGDVERLGAPVARTLLDPFAVVLDTVDRLLVVHAPSADALPLHALPWRDAPLGATHAVSYLPSASSAGFAAPGAGLPDRVLVVGDPAGAAWPGQRGEPARPAPPAPATATEAALVGSLFADARLLVGAAATEPAVRAEIGAWPVVHLAARGSVHAAAPLLSSVQLADGDELSVYELIGLGLDADLLVLSAWEIGGGRACAAGDVLGLARGVLAAGVRGAVMSLWPAGGRTTCVLMAHFYRLLRAGLPAPVALQRAQAHVRALTDEAEEAEFAVLTAAVDDPAADLRSPPADAGPHTPPGGTPGPGRTCASWAGFVYVGR